MCLPTYYSTTCSTSISPHYNTRQHHNKNVKSKHALREAAAGKQASPIREDDATSAIYISLLNARQLNYPFLENRRACSVNKAERLFLTWLNPSDRWRLVFRKSCRAPSTPVSLNEFLKGTNIFLWKSDLNPLVARPRCRPTLTVVFSNSPTLTATIFVNVVCYLSTHDVKVILLQMSRQDRHFAQKWNRDLLQLVKFMPTFF